MPRTQQRERLDLSPQEEEPYHLTRREWGKYEETPLLPEGTLRYGFSTEREPMLAVVGLTHRKLWETPYVIDLSRLIHALNHEGEQVEIATGLLVRVRLGRMAVVPHGIRAGHAGVEEVRSYLGV